MTGEDSLGNTQISEIDTGESEIVEESMITKRHKIARIRSRGVFEALDYSEGGGWALFIMAMLGIIIVPLMIVWVIQCVVHFIGWSEYRKNNVTRARILGMINAIIGTLANLVMIAISAAMCCKKAA